MNFRHDIQGLRALAVIFVFIFHLSSNYLPGGFIGVDMFFVISGYLISKIIIDKINKGKFNIWDFYLSRIKRIVPAYFFLLITVAFLFLFIFTNSEVNKFKGWHFWTFIFNSNNHFSKIDDYFGASSSENPLLHSWTLSVEMQFYFILPVLLLFIRNLKILITIFFIITIGLFVYSTIEIINGNKTNMYFSLLSRSPEFLIGSLISITKIEDLKNIKKSRNLLSIVGFILLLSSLIFLNEKSDFPGLSALIPCIGIGLLLLSNGSKLNDLLSSKPLVYIGEISYSLYLWHWPVMAFLRYKNQTYEFGFSDTTIIILLTIVLSLISYYCIEKPFRTQSAFKFYFPFGLLIATNASMIFFIAPIKNIITPIPPEFGYPKLGLDSHSNRFKHVETLGDTLTQGKRILLLGDSHALTFKPYLNELGKKHAFHFRTITNDLYPTIPNIPEEDIKDPNKLIVYQKLLPYIKSEVDSADVIIVFFAEDGQKWKNSINNMLASLKNKQKVLFISDYPTLDKNPARTNSIINIDNNIKYKIKYPKIDKGLVDIITNNQNARIVDLSEDLQYFKDAPFRNDTLIYYDSSHLNEYGSISYANYSGDLFMRYLNWATN